MIEKQIINKVWNNVSFFSLCSISLKQAFLEVVLNIESQKVFPETYNDFNKLSRVVTKLNKEICSKN